MNGDMCNGSSGVGWDSTDVVIPNELGAAYLGHPGFRHAFWDWFSRGAFTKCQLECYALAYYPHVVRFRDYPAGLCAILPPSMEGMKVALAGILADEFGLSGALPSHPDMFRNFMRSLGLQELDWQGAAILDGLQDFIDAHWELIDGRQVERAVGAIVFGCEMTTPHRHKRVCEGIEKFNLRTGEAVDSLFFSSHVSIDDVHSSSLLVHIADWMRDPEKRELLKEGTRISFDARERFLNDLSEAVGANLSSVNAFASGPQGA